MTVSGTLLPEMSLRDDGIIIVEWPDGRPDWFKIDSNVFDELIRQINQLRQIMAVLQ